MKGFTLHEQRFIAEANAQGFVYTHDKTGAKLIHLANDDNNKCFMISFPTKPEDSTGVAHIIEHSVLAGSEKYPLKDPFFELVKGSMNTFLNAMTAPDFTMYPFASTNEKDFMNILDVYLDAVFHPTLYRKVETFRQEGWHYEINENDELIVNGIVYNEMRGAMSSPDRVLYQQMLTALFDNCYQYNAGGDPAVIPELTHEAFCAFHSKHYHPSNATIFLYGDVDAEKVMSELDDKLSEFERIDQITPIEPTKAFSAPVTVTEYYPVNSEEETAHACMLGEGFVCCGAEDVVTSTAIAILATALFATEASPVRRALLQSGLCSDVDLEYDDSMCQNMLALMVKGADEENLEAIEELIDSTLADVYEAGIDKDILRGCLNRLEFSLREEHDGIPRGLLLGMKAATDAMYNDDCFASMCYESTLKTLRDNLDSWYFEELIDRYLLGNAHRANIHMLPRVGLAQERDKALADRLAAYKATLTDEQIEQIKTQAEELKRLQMAEDTPETLALIPVLERDDVKEGPTFIDAQPTSFGDIPGLYCNVSSNGICYLKLIFDADCLTEEDLHYAGLLSDIIGKVNTNEQDFGTIAKKTMLYTGGLSFGCSAAGKMGDASACNCTAKLSAKVLTSELEPAIKLIAEILSSSRYDNKNRISELVGTLVAQNQAMLMYRGNSIAMERVLSYFSKTGMINQKIGGLDHIKWLNTAAADIDNVCGNIIAGIERVAKKLFCKANLTVAVTGGEAELEKVREYLPILTDALPEGEKVTAEIEFTEQPLNEGIATVSDSQYVAQGYNIAKLGYEFSGKLAVLRTMLSTGYLLQRVRIVGGAYGCHFLLQPTGSCIFCSYRDPNLAATYNVFKESPDFVRGYEGSERELLKYIIGTLSSMDTPEAPSGTADRAVSDYYLGITSEMRAKWREEALNTTIDDLHDMADMLKAVIDKNCLCVFGGTEKIQNEGSMLSATVTPAAEPDKYTF